jgi:hypothetical protein
MLALLVTTGLLFVAALRSVGTVGWGVTAAALFLLTPLLWGQAATALSPLVFIAGWLVATTCVDGTRRPWDAAVAGALLGAGMYTSNAAAVQMPLYLALTIGTLAWTPAASRRSLLAAGAAFAVAAAPYAATLAVHPEVFRRAIAAHHLYDVNRFNVLQGVHEMGSWVGLTARSEVFYDYFNPAFLFADNRVLLFPLALLIPAGMVQALVEESAPMGRLISLGFLVSPFAAALTADPPVAARVLFATPFAAILGAYGVKYLTRWRLSFAGVRRTLASLPRL